MLAALPKGCGSPEGVDRQSEHGVRCLDQNKEKMGLCKGGAEEGPDRQVQGENGRGYQVTVIILSDVYQVGTMFFISTMDL